MTDLSRCSVLQRVPDLRVDIDSSGNLRIRTPGGNVACGPHGLAVLDAFSRPTSVSGALETLQTRVAGAQEWMDLTGTVVRLYKAGVLREEGRAGPALGSDASAYDAAPIHVAMLNDRARTSRFLAAIREVVRPGDVVVDVGTGTGVLAIAAARAGARHVYAVEASGMGRSARAVFEANGLGERITLVQGWSTRISLPERADVLVSEMIGHEPLEEGVLEVTADAVKRLLKPEARLVPGRVALWGLPVTLPDAELRRHTFTAETLQNWRSWYGIDFGPLVAADQSAPYAFLIPPHKARGWTALSAPVLLAGLDLKAVGGAAIERAVGVTATTSGRLNGLLVYFELELGPTTRLSTHPAEAGGDSHWGSPVWVLGDPLSVRPGDRLEVAYGYRAAGGQSTVRVSRA